MLKRGIGCPHGNLPDTDTDTHPDPDTESGKRPKAMLKFRQPQHSICKLNVCIFCKFV